ncbi:MAG: nitroreductase family protein [Ruminococcaceae bacterium]|nr:nitroreductase family protein [Oscillospiraceae bacterium]
MIEELVLKNRSYRAFDEGTPITRQQMTALVDLARRTASGMNKQPLRYRILTEKSDLGKMLGNCRFAASLGIPLPPKGKHPTGFILMLADSEAGSPDALMKKDVGIAAQTILLGAVEMGFGGCMLASFDPKRMSEDFGIDERYVPQLAIALGKPAEEVALADSRDGTMTYWRDENGTHFVPKHTLDEILI